jgi:hypothetical protein
MALCQDPSAALMSIHPEYANKILDGSIPPVWQIIVNGPSKQEDKDSLKSFTVVKIN